MNSTLSTGAWQSPPTLMRCFCRVCFGIESCWRLGQARIRKNSSGFFCQPVRQICASGSYGLLQRISFAVPTFRLGCGSERVWRRCTWIFVGSAIGSSLSCGSISKETPHSKFSGHIKLWATWPTVFRKIARSITKSETPDQNFFAGLDLRAMSFGWIVMSLGWRLNGLSLWLVI